MYVISSWMLQTLTGIPDLECSEEGNSSVVSEHGCEKGTALE